MQEVLKMKFEDITVSIPVSKDRLLYVFMADTTEEFERRFEQLANDLQIQIEKEMFKKVIEKELKKK